MSAHLRSNDGPVGLTLRPHWNCKLGVVVHMKFVNLIELRYDVCVPRSGVAVPGLMGAVVRGSLCTARVPACAGTRSQALARAARARFKRAAAPSPPHRVLLEREAQTRPRPLDLPCPKRSKKEVKCSWRSVCSFCQAGARVLRALKEGVSPLLQSEPALSEGTSDPLPVLRGGAHSL